MKASYSGLRHGAPPILAGCSAALYASAFSDHGLHAIAVIAVATGTGLLAVAAGWPR